MGVIYFGIFIVFLVTYSVNRNFRQKKSKITSLVIITVLTFVAAFKSIDSYYVDDLVNYRNMYFLVKENTYHYLWSQYQNGELKDFGFWAFSKIFADWNFSVELWMAIIGFIFAGAFSWLCYQYSKDEFISFLMLVAFTFSFTLSGLRQTMALAFILVSYHWIIERKFIKYFISVILAACFHSTAILFLPAYLISKLKIGRKHFIYILAFILLSSIFPDVFRNLITIFAWNDQIAGYSDRAASLTWSGFIIQMAIFVFCYVFRNQSIDIDERKINDVLLNCMMVGLCFQGMSTIIAEAFRVTYYYSICAGIAVANVIYETRLESNRKILFIGVIFALLAYMIWSGAYSNLVFVWES